MSDDLRSHSCDNCDGIDPASCINAPTKPPMDDDLRHRCADKLLAKDAESWGYGTFEGDRDAALAVADVALAVQNPELETLRRANGIQRDQIRAYISDHQEDTAKWSRDLETTRAEIARLREYTVHRRGCLFWVRRPCDCGLDTPPFEIIEMTHEEWETARDNDLAKLGCTLEALQEMARTGDYATPGHRALWLAIKPVPRGATS